MAFHCNLFESTTIKRSDRPTGRVYITPENNEYVSVTNALSYFSKKGIAQWKERVGQTEANHIAGVAARLGTTVHDLLEKHVLGVDVSSYKTSDPIAYERFTHIKKVLDDNITDVYGVELQMYSDEIRSAGTCDLMCKFANKKTILDHKTSRRIKTKEQVFTYFMQGAAYAIMAKERYDFEAEQIVIAITVADEGLLLFTEPTSEWIPMTKKFFKLYNQGRL